MPSLAEILFVSMAVFSRVRYGVSIATTAAIRVRPTTTTTTRIIRWPTHLPFNNYEYLSTAAPDALTRTAIRKMKVAQLREELEHRGLEALGTRPQLLERLFGAIEEPCPITIEKTVEQEQEEVTLVDAEGFLEQGLQMADYAPLDPDRTYIIQVRTAPSGNNRVVDGFGIGMTLSLVQDNTKSHVLQNNQLLLPGQRTPFEAVYCALIMAMRYAKQRHATNLILETENLGIVRLLTGQGSSKNGTGLYQKELHEKAIFLKQSFQHFDIRQCDNDQTQVLAKTALAKQRHLESDWQDMVDPLTDTPTTSRTAQHNRTIPIDPQKEYLLQFDGGARGNPVGRAGAGMVIFDSDEEIWCGWKFLGKGHSNNIAEYQSLIEGLEHAQKLGIRRIRAQGDSQLIVRQLLGEYKVRKDHLIPLHRRAKELSAGFDSFAIDSIPRADNKRADYLANHAMDLEASGSANEM